MDEDMQLAITLPFFLNTFSARTGLAVNNIKSNIYSAVDNVTSISIQTVLGFKTGFLPIRDLSYAGRILLIKVILSSILIYWTSCFVLPKKTIKCLNNLFKTFIWAGYEVKYNSQLSNGPSFVFLIKEEDWV